MVNTILKEADLFCPNSVRINFTIYHKRTKMRGQSRKATH
ncbi:ABC transporter ATP-binding protein [Lactiplantibacillus plantarum]|nr:ABC transporter ATP-binding protein [Lactiplantibacillus plantarum]